MYFKIKSPLLVAILMMLASACKDLNTINYNDPDRNDVLATGSDLRAVLNGGFVSWWQGVHSEHPVIALSVAADAYGMSWSNFGAQRMGEEPRDYYNNRTTEESDYKQVAVTPWFGCLSAASSANDVLAALEEGVTIDNGGPQDLSIGAAAHLLRGLSWGYLGLVFDESFLVKEQADLGADVELSAYRDLITTAVEELETAIDLAAMAGDEFTFAYFNGLVFNRDEFSKLSHSYAARFLSQWPRTTAENEEVEWMRVLDHASQGLNFNFAPLADGNQWQSYHKYVFAETGQGPFWARVDQRLVAALDPSQPARYPEVIAKGEPPLANPEASSPDRRLLSDFIFLPQNNFPVERGEWHFSHYKHNRNVNDPSFAGDGLSVGPMPVFLAADNDLLIAEALLRLERTGEAIAAVNKGSRVIRGRLAPLPPQATPAQVEQAILYERAIELLSTAPMGIWFDRRRTAPRVDYLEVDALGGLQKGTPAQLPVPAYELQIKGLDPYNYGGFRDPEGIVPVY